TPPQRSGYPTPTPTRPVLNAPWTQPPHPPYYPPRPPILRPTDQYGGPTNLPNGFCLPGQGAPPPPPPSGYGWNNGPPSGAPPRNWEGPPPSGGWNGPPPAGGWNQPWQGPPVDQSYGQNYYAPFTYNNFTVLPVFNADYGGFGYWFFGVWVPLY
ncbi:MAG TPA: MAP_0585 family protein, partial [Mycobacterium sp.]